MGWVLLSTLVKEKPFIGKTIRINDYTDDDSRAVERKIDLILSKIYADGYEAEFEIDGKDEVYAIPFLAEEIKNTAKMKKIEESRLKIKEKSRLLMSEWKERALVISKKTCYSCASKISQNHEKVKLSRYTYSDCPNCKAKNYLLTKASRLKIEKNKIKEKELLEDFTVLKEIEIEKKIKDPKTKIHYIVGAWVHESEL